MGAAAKESTAVATREEKREDKSIAGFITQENVRKRIEPFLPRGTSVDRVAAAVYFATKQNPKLLECTPESIIMSVARIQQWGLEIGTTAHLVPYGTVCTPIADYKGIAELMVASGAVRYVAPAAVYEQDEFEYEKGLEPKLRHVPESDASKRGKLIGAYVVLRLPGGLSEFEFMSIIDIDAIRKKHSKQWKDGECPPWYAKKTVIRQVSKLIPKTKRLAAALRVIDEDLAAEFDELPTLDPARALPSGREGFSNQHTRIVTEEEYGGGKLESLDPQSLKDGDEPSDEPQSSLHLPD